MKGAELLLHGEVLEPGRSGDGIFDGRCAVRSRGCCDAACEEAALGCADGGDCFETGCLRAGIQGSAGISGQYGSGAGEELAGC